MVITAGSPEEYISLVPEERQPQIRAVRDVILKNLQPGFEEGMQYNMIGYYVPHSIYPAGYHCDPKQPLPYLAIGSQKNHMALYACTLYMDPQVTEWFVQAYKESGKKMDMGKGCVRFRTIDNLPLDVVGELVAKTTVESLVAIYENAIASRKG